MSILKAFQFIYGAFMGTTTQYLKANRKSIQKQDVEKWTEQVGFVLGGSGNQMYVELEDCVCLFDCGLQTFTDLPDKKLYIFLSSVSNHRVASLKNYNAAKVFAPICEETKKYFPDNVFSVNAIKEEEALGSVLDWICFKNSHSFLDVIYVLKKEKLLFCGELFYNQVHPEIRPDLGMNLNSWIQALKDLKAKYSDYHYFPGEGQLAGVNELDDFVEYLKAMMDPKLEFRYMRENFDWKEVESYTSLEENFDLIRRIGPGIRYD